MTGLSEWARKDMHTDRSGQWIW